MFHRGLERSWFCWAAGGRLCCSDGTFCTGKDVFSISYLHPWPVSLLVLGCECVGGGISWLVAMCVRPVRCLISCCSPRIATFCMSKSLPGRSQTQGGWSCVRDIAAPSSLCGAASQAPAVLCKHRLRLLLQQTYRNLVSRMTQDGHETVQRCRGLSSKSGCVE